MYKTRRNCNAFTLAEVLITLGIIGVVAAVTLPTLINEHRISQWETALKRDYTVLSQGFRKMMADYGCDTLECTGIFDAQKDENGKFIQYYDRLTTELRKTLDIVKVYNPGEGTTKINYKLKTRDTTPISWSNTSFLRFKLSDGAMIYLKYSSDFSNSKVKDVAFMYVDLNDNQLPNTRGKDIFGLGHLMNDGTIVPDTSQKWVEYTSNSSSYWRNSPVQCGKPDTKLKDDTTTNVDGQNCLARIMENNWRMDYLH